MLDFKHLDVADVSLCHARDKYSSMENGLSFLFKNSGHRSNYLPCVKPSILTYNCTLTTHS